MMLLPPAIIGIVGGGQLGRMSAMAAARLGYRTHIYTPEADCPAAQVTPLVTVGAYDDVEALTRFARMVDVVTFEFENIPHNPLSVLESLVPVRPGANVLMLSQNRLREKRFAQGLGITTAPFFAVTGEEELRVAVEMLGGDAILKTAEMGYDGKGQRRIRPGDDLAAAWSALNTHEAIAEGVVDFEREISVIIARNEKGEAAFFPPVENRHANHILDVTLAPAQLAPAIIQHAEQMAMKLADALSLAGLLAVEMFVTRDGQVLMNEIAPRPHNSGHWTLDACVTSQFEQHIRAVCNLPLGATRPLCRAVMKNLIGSDVEHLDAYRHNPMAKLHLYGKKEARAGRKMGHVTLLEPDAPC